MLHADKKNNHNIGVFGGTFDPVHEGHVALAQYVLDMGVTGEILFLPAACPPHKSSATALFSHRLAMLQLALTGKEKMAVSSLEAKRDGPSYTVDSLRLLRNSFPAGQLSFLMGADSLLELHLWYKYTEILRLADLIVVARKGISARQCRQTIVGLPGGYTMVPGTDPTVFRHSDGAEILYLAGFTHAVSSSMVRRQLQAGIRPRGLDENVFSYIQEHHLYS